MYHDVRSQIVNFNIVHYFTATIVNFLIFTFKTDFKEPGFEQIILFY
jgi:hypothetical protein